MARDRVLSQEEIDSVFKTRREKDPHDDEAHRAQSYDFRRTDRIAKDQLRAIHLLHENFARSLASSLSAYLRAYVIVNLVSVEQLSFSEFTQCLPSPTVISALAMSPFDGNAVLELNPALVFPVVEILLGGGGKGAPIKMDRETTEIEQSILDGVYRIVLRDMQEAWLPITAFDLAVKATETEPQMLQLLAPNEAVVAISMEVRVGDAVGLMNIGIPSIIIKMLRQRFDQQWSMKKAESSRAEQHRRLKLVGGASMYLDVRLRGAYLSTADLLAARPGDVIKLDWAINTPPQLEINGANKYSGTVVERGARRCFRLDKPVPPTSARFTNHRS